MYYGLAVALNPSLSTPVARSTGLGRMVTLTSHNDCLAVDQIKQQQTGEHDDDDCVNSAHVSLLRFVYCTTHAAGCQRQNPVAGM